MNRNLPVYLFGMALVSLGMYIHVFLFNIHLADLHFHEDWMGRLGAAVSIGNLAGTLPAAALARRFGLRRTILAALAGLTAALLLRPLANGPALVAASGMMGFFLAGWFVTMFPAIAALGGGGESKRATAFSLNTALGIGIGTLGGVLAGHLPAWVHAASNAEASRTALLLSAVPVVLGMAVISQVHFGEEARLQGWESLALLQRSPARSFILRFLAAVALWYAFSAGFAPFFNVYLRDRIGVPLRTVGGVFAMAHVIQALAALLMVPLVARMGLVRAVLTTQVLSAAGVFSMWGVHSLAAVSAVYVFYLSFQVMSEPGLQNFLMSRVPVADRPAAAALNMLVMIAVQTPVAPASGALIVAHGYGALFIALGLTGLAAAALFAGLFSRAFHSESALPSSAAGNPRARGE